MVYKNYDGACIPCSGEAWAALVAEYLLTYGAFPLSRVVLYLWDKALSECRMEFAPSLSAVGGAGGPGLVPTSSDIMRGVVA